MAVKLMGYPTTGQVSLFTEIGTTGAWDDPLAARNAPLISPAANLSLVKFHSDLDYLEVAFTGTVSSITHASVAAIATPSNFAVSYGTNAGGDDNLLFTHSLGYIPFYLVIIGSDVLWPGMAIQTGSNGAARYAACYATTTTLRVATKATIGSTTLAATTPTYRYMIFKKPPAPSGSVWFSFDASTGIVTMGYGKFHSDARYLQVVPGGSPFGLVTDRTIDLNNGAPKGWSPSGSTVAPVPSTLKSFLPFLTYSGADLGGETAGASMAYGGSYTGPAGTVQVQAP